MSETEHAAIPGLSLDGLAEELGAKARQASAGRAARTVHGGHTHALRQTVVALAGGSALDDHESPGEATLQVLSGRVRLVAGTASWDGAAGDIAPIPDARHRLEALEDAAVLLTVVVTPTPDRP